MVNVVFFFFSYPTKYLRVRLRDREGRNQQDILLILYGPDFF